MMALDYPDPYEFTVSDLFDGTVDMNRVGFARAFGTAGSWSPADFGDKLIVEGFLAQRPRQYLRQEGDVPPYDPDAWSSLDTYFVDVWTNSAYRFDTIQEVADLPSARRDARFRFFPLAAVSGENELAAYSEHFEARYWGGDDAPSVESYDPFDIIFEDAPGLDDQIVVSGRFVEYAYRVVSPENAFTTTMEVEINGDILSGWSGVVSADAGEIRNQSGVSPTLTQLRGSSSGPYYAVPLLGAGRVVIPPEAVPNDLTVRLLSSVMTTVQTGNAYELLLVATVWTHVTVIRPIRKVMPFPVRIKSDIQLRLEPGPPQRQLAPETTHRARRRRDQTR